MGILEIAGRAAQRRDAEERSFSFGMEGLVTSLLPIGIGIIGLVAFS